MMTSTDMFLALRLVLTVACSCLHRKIISFEDMSVSSAPFSISSSQEMHDDPAGHVFHQLTLGHVQVWWHRPAACDPGPALHGLVQTCVRSTGLGRTYLWSPCSSHRSSMSHRGLEERKTLYSQVEKQMNFWHGLCSYFTLWNDYY